VRINRMLRVAFIVTLHAYFLASSSFSEEVSYETIASARVPRSEHREPLLKTRNRTSDWYCTVREGLRRCRTSRTFPIGREVKGGLVERACIKSANIPLGLLNESGSLAPGVTVVVDASYYGKSFHQRPTTSGETYNMYAYTAAHPTLPFGSRLLVCNPEAGRCVTVKVNDRGSFCRKYGRGLDLSKRAACTLGFCREGTAQVYATVLSVPSNKRAS